MPAKSGKSKKRGTSRTAKSGRSSSQFIAGTVSKKRSSQTKKKKTAKRDTPEWLHWLATACIVLLVLAGAWLFFLSPYIYRWRPCFAEKEYGVCLPSGYLYYGIDISHHQGDIDWERLSLSSESKEYPLKFVIMKATEGGTFKDPNFDSNMAAARRSGFVCGAYHYYNPSTSPSRQSDFFIRNVSLQPGDLAPVVDVETVPENKTEMARELLSFLSALESHYGVKPVIYASARFRRTYLDSPVFEKYPFWIAHYYVDEPDTEYDWSFWQFSDRARVDGIGGFTDFDVFRGTAADFESLRKK
ncbi:MAG: glycoside hydrolase family 25 protein [Bacteroidaceae bacterium]|nr:glycoside hydrolase family 25 protein [Bacteroidaceae bacterium]